MSLLKNSSKITALAIPAVLLVALLASTPILQAFADNTGPIRHHPMPIVKTKNGTSSNWSGYAAESSLTSPQSGFANKALGTWTIPSVICNSTNTYSSVWVGIDGYSSTSVEQLGTEQDCSGGQQSYYAWYEMYPQPGYYIPITVYPGDTITASVTYSGGIFTLSMQDLTSSHLGSFSKSFAANAQRSSAEWIVEAPYSGGILPLANFGTATFSTAQFTDSTGTTFAVDGRGSGTYDAITIIDPSGGKAIPSSLIDSGASSSFSVTYQTRVTAPSLSVSSNPTSITTAQSSTIMASTSNGASGVLISFTTNLGSLSAPSCTTGTTGSCSVTFSSAGTGTATISASAPSYTSSSTSVTVNSISSTATLSVSASPDKASYPQKSSAYITVKTTANGSPISGVSVTITITAPNGGVSQGSAITANNGQVTFQYRIAPHAPTGTYKVTAQASASGFNSGSGTTTFSVT